MLQTVSFGVPFQTDYFSFQNSLWNRNTSFWPTLMQELVRNSLPEDIFEVSDSPGFFKAFDV